MLLETVGNIDNWALIKTIGGISVIISALFTFIGWLLRDRISLIWKSKLETNLSQLKGQIDLSNQSIAALTDKQIDTLRETNKKKIESAELLWQSALNIRDNLPTEISIILHILSDAQHNLKEFEFLSSKFNNFLSPKKEETYVEIVNKEVSKIEKLKPFISEKLWFLFRTYQILFARTAYLLIDSYSKKELKFWKKDEFLINAILVAVEKKDLEEILSYDTRSFEILKNYFENQILNEISKLTLGTEVADISVNEIKRITELLDKKE